MRAKTWDRRHEARSHVQLHLRELLLSDEHLVATVYLDEGQREFSGGHTHEIFDRLRSNPYPSALHPFIVIHDESAIGFFVLKEAPALPAWALPDVMTLHNFRVGSQFQRRGFGAATVRKAAQWVADNRPSISQLMLSVNAENEPAFILYQSCGFHPIGTLFEGRIGPERIMVGEIATILA